MLWKCCIQYVSKSGKLSSGHRIGKVSFHSNPKERQCQRIFKLPHDCTHLICLQVQFSSVTQSCLTLCDPLNHSTPGLPVRHQLPEFTQTHVHWVRDAIQPSHSLSSPSPPTLKLSPQVRERTAKINGTCESLLNFLSLWKFRAHSGLVSFFDTEKWLMPLVDKLHRTFNSLMKRR